MILVTGGTGLLGAQLLLDLSKADKQVRALKRATSSMYTVNNVFRNHAQLLGAIEWIEGDITDPFAVDAAMKGVNEVYHCAAMVSFQPRDYTRMLKTNTDGTANMVNFALKHVIEKFCHVSSVAALGRSEVQSIVDENTFWKTSKRNSTYAISKYASEREVWRAMEEGLNAVIVNPSIIVGQGDWKSGSSQIFSQIYRSLKFYTKGVSGFVDVADVTRCMIELMNRNIFGQRFIINAENICWKDFLTDVAKALGKNPPSIYANKYLGEFAWRADALKRMLTGYKSLITKETARQGHMRSTYSNEKIRKAIDINFRPIREAVVEAANKFLQAKAQGLANQPVVALKPPLHQQPGQAEQSSSVSLTAID